MKTGLPPMAGTTEGPSSIMTDASAPGAATLFRRLRWPLASLAVLFAAYSAVGFLLVPRLARGAIEDHVTDTLHRRVAMGEIAFNPYTLVAEVKDFALSEADGTPIVRFGSLFVNASAASLFSGAWTFDEIRLDKPDIRIDVDPQGTVNLAKLIPPDDEPDAPPPSVRIGTLAVTGGRVGFTDRSRPHPFSTTISPIRFTLNDFETTQDHSNAYRFEGTTLAGETLSWSGSFTVQPLGSRGTFSVAGLKSGTVAAYLHDLLPFEVPTGTIGLKGDYDAVLGDKIALKVRLPAIDVKDVVILPRGGDPKAPWITVPAASVADVALSLTDRTVTVGTVKISAPKASIRREADGSINLMRLMPAEGAPPSSEAAEAPWTISLGTLAVENADIDAEDAAVTPAVKLKLAPVSVSVTGYSTAPDASLKIDGTAGIGPGRVSVAGDVALSPLSAKVTVGADGLDMTVGQPYLKSLTPVVMTSGHLSGSTKVAWRAEPAKGQPALAVAGNVTVTDFAMHDGSGRPGFLAWKRLDVKGIDFSQSPDRLIIDLIEARALQNEVVIGADRSVNLTKVMTPGAPPPVIAGERLAKAAAKSSMPIRIREFRVTGGRTNFADLSIEPNFAATIFDLGGSIKGLSSAPNARATLALSGKVDRYAPVEIAGTLNLLSAETFADVEMKFRNIELTTFNPYSGKYAGYNIAKGKLNTEMHYRVEDRKLDAKHHVVLDQLEFGEATGSKEAVPLPVRLAVSLLKDRRGVIDLDLPVTGSLDDPQFSVAPVVWQALRNVLAKIVTAPFALLGSLFGGGPEISYVDFAAGSAVLPPDQAEKLAKLAKGLAERPQLRLDVPLGAVSDADGKALADGAFDAALAPFLAKEDATPEGRREALAGLYKAQFGDGPDYPETADGADKTAERTAFLENALRPRFAATPAAAEALGRARAEAVQAAILSNTEVAPERVFLSTGGPAKPAPSGARLELRLE
jgi:uncharacterized protein involved in outer membrane biogenesis